MSKRRGKRKIRLSAVAVMIQKAYDEVMRERVVAPAKLTKAQRKRIREEQQNKDYRDWYAQETVNLLRPQA